MGRKYTAVRVGTIRYHPCTFSFVEGAARHEYFVVVDSKQATTTINVDHIDQFAQDHESMRLVLVYHIPNEDGKLVKKKDEYECAESEHLLKTFGGIRNKTVGLGLIDDFTTGTKGNIGQSNSSNQSASQHKEDESKP